MIGDVLVKVSADITDFTRNITSAANQMRHLGDDLQQAGQGIAMTFGSIAAASTLAIGSTVKAASDYESAFAGVRKTVDGTEADFQRLSKGIIDMSKRMPESAEDIAAVAESAGQLGIKTDAIMGFTETMVMMGTATNMSSTDAAEALARLANITQMPQDEFDRLGSTVVALGNNLAATETDIVNMGLRIAGAGNTVGMSEDQILSFAGALSSVGIEAEMGGSAISRVMVDISSAVNNGGEDLENFAKVAGMSSSEFKEAFEKDAATGIIAFIEGLGKMQESGQDTFGVLDELGLSEIRVRDTLLRAAGAGDLFAESLEIGSDAWKENTALTNEAAERYKTFESQLTIFLNKIKDIFRTIGGPFLSALSALMSAAQPLLDLFQRLADWFANSGKSMQIFITAMAIAVPVVGAIVAGFGIFLAAVGSIVMAIGTLVVAFMALSAAGIGLGTAVTGLFAIFAGLFVIIPLVVGLVAVIIAKWDELKAATSNLTTDFGGSMKALGGIIADVASSVASKAGELAMSLLNILPQPVQDVIRAGVEAVSGFLANLRQAFSDVLAGDFGKLGEIIAQLIPTIIGILVGGLPGLLIAGSRFLPAISEGITSNIGILSEKANEIITTLLTGITTYLPIILQAGVQLIQTILNGIVTALPLVIEAITTLITFILTTLAENLPTILEAGVTILTTLLNGLVSALPVIIEVITTLISTITMVIAGLLPLIIQAGIELLVALINGIVQALPLIIETVVSLITTLITTIVELLPIIIEAGLQIVTGLIEGIIAALPQIIDAIIMLITSLLDVIVQNLPLIIDAGVQVLLALVQGIIDALPQLIEATLLLIISVVGAIIENLPKILEAGVQLLLALIDGIIQIIPQLIGAIIEIIGVIIDTLIDHVPELLKMGVELMDALIDGIFDMIGEVGQAALDIGSEILDSIGSIVGDMIDIGADIINGLVKGIQSIDIGGIVKGVADKIPNWVKDKLGINSPSRVMRDQVGRWIPAGIGVGIEKGEGSVMKAAQRMAEDITRAATPTMPSIATPDVRGFERSMNGQMRMAAAQINGNVAFEGNAPVVNVAVRNDWDGNQVRTKVNTDNAWDSRKAQRY